MTKNERLEIFGGSKGEDKWIVSRRIDQFEKREGAMPT
jgi:hypothetical protein